MRYLWRRENATIWESKSNECYEYQCHNEPIYFKRGNATIWENKSNECYEFQCDVEPIYKKRDNATVWESKSNECYEFECDIDNGPIYNKRENATVWESKSNGCYEFHCDIDNGPVYWKQCNKTDEICENDHCVLKNEEMTYFVEIEVEGIDVTNLNMTEIQSTISNLTGIKAEELKIRADISNNNEVIHIIVIVDDEETAEKVSESINAEINKHNQDGFLRNCKSARVIGKENKPSISRGMVRKEGIISTFIIVFMTSQIQW